MAARSRRKEARARRTKKKWEAIEEDLAENPGSWPCPKCELKPDEHHSQFRNAWNLSSDKRCRNCNHPKPTAANSYNNENIQWTCGFCSTRPKDTTRLGYCDDFSINGSQWYCPECGEEFDWSQDHHVLVETELAEAEVIQPWCGGRAANSNPFMKRKSRRGGVKNKKQGVPQSSEPSLAPARDADDRWNRSRDAVSSESDAPGRKKERHVSSGSRSHTLGMVCVIAVGQIGSVEGVENTATAAVALLVAATTASVLVSQRGVDAVDVVIGAVENKTVEFVGAVGDEGFKMIPVVLGIIMVLMLILLRQVTERFWWSKKEMLKAAGQNPEANVDAEYPYIQWLSQDFLAREVANLDGAKKIAANARTDIQRKADTMFSYNYTVKSQSGGKTHLVRLARVCINPLQNGPRTVISCSCRGYIKALADSGRLCQHSGGVLLMCKKKHRAASLGDRGALCLGDRSPPKRRAEPSGRDQDWLSEPLTNATSEDESPLALQNYPDPPTATMPVEPKVYRGNSAALLDNRENPQSGSRSGGRAAVRPLPPKPRFIAEREHVAAEAILRRALAEETDPARLVPACDTAWQQRAEELAKADTNPLRGRRPYVTSLEPSVGAALKSTSPPEYGSRILFAGYQESADDAAHLMLDGGGIVLSVMSAKQTQKMAVYLITKAVKNIIMTVYTYDLLVIGDALKTAAGRGVKVEVIADYGHTLTGTTVAMVERMKGLLESGVHVVLLMNI